jgi:short-chain 2-methylacyl-CoA dehydrogenase
VTTDRRQHRPARQAGDVNNSVFLRCDQNLWIGSRRVLCRDGSISLFCSVAVTTNPNHPSEDLTTMALRPFLNAAKSRVPKSWSCTALTRHHSSSRPFSSSSANDASFGGSIHDAPHHSSSSPVTTFSEDEEMIRQAARAWARSELLPVVREMDNDAKLKPEILQSLFDQGFMGMEISEEYGGAGLSFTSACLVIEEISRIDPSVSILVDIHNTLTSNAVRFWGSADLQERWLPRLAANTVSSFCLSEAGSGSDAFAMKTTAIWDRGSNSYILNGSKLWISSSKEAGVFLVFANANPDKGYKGITAFMVDSSTPGITVGSPEGKLGLRASSTCPVVFENVQVDTSNVLGEVGLGYKYCINILNEGRIGIAAQQLGIAKGCMDIVMPYLMERQQFGQAIGSFQVGWNTAATKPGDAFVVGRNQHAFTHPVSLLA